MMDAVIDTANLHLLLKLLHIIGATVLFGTGAGIAFFMLMAHRTGDKHVIAATASIVVIADFLFTATAAVIQPVTGAALMVVLGYSLADPWILAAIGLYLFVGVFWLPVVFIQMKMRNLACEAVADNRELPPLYHRLFRIWFAFGFPAFAAMVGLFAVMIWKPVW